MSSFLNKFKKSNPADVPACVKVENTSFGQQNGTYQPPVIPAVQLPQSNQPRQKGKPGGGWQDDELEAEQQQAPQQNKKPTNTINLINDTPPKQSEQKGANDVLLPPQPSFNQIQMSRVADYKRGQLLTYEELELGGFEYEFHLVDEVIKLGGIKLKQSDAVLKEYARAVQSLQEQLIGSILLNKLYSEENWKVQIRCVYAIQFVCQQFQNYRDFFQINQQYLKIESDQQIMQSAIEQTLAEINGQQTQNKKEFQIEFREPPKPQTQQVPVQQQPNLIDILETPQQQQNKPQQQKLDLKSLKIKQPQQQQQQPIQIQQPIQVQQPIVQQPKQSQQQANQINLLEAFSDISLQSYEQTKQPQPQVSAPQSISFENLLNPQPQPQQQISQPPPQQKKNAFGFIKKDAAQQQQPPQIPVQPQQNLYQIPQTQNYTQQIPYQYNGQQYQPPQPVYQQAFQQYNNQQQQYTLVQQAQFTNGQPQQPPQQKTNPKDNAFDFLNL